MKIKKLILFQLIGMLMPMLRMNKAEETAEVRGMLLMVISICFTISSWIGAVAICISIVLLFILFGFMVCPFIGRVEKKKEQRKMKKKLRRFKRQWTQKASIN